MVDLGDNAGKPLMVLDLQNVPNGFHEDPFPHYAKLLAGDPLCVQADGSVLLSRHADLERVYKDTALFRSDKRAIFEQKFGAGSSLFEHHTTSLVFNDPPLHSRVRRIMSSALTPRAIKRLEPGLIETVDNLLDNLGSSADLIEDFAAQIPIQIIGNLLGIPMADRGIELIQNCIFILNAGHETTTNLIAVFVRPEQFDITRKPNRHLAFAGGPHVCVGLTLARLEGRAALAGFLSRVGSYEITSRVQGARIRFRGFKKLAAVLA